MKLSCHIHVSFTVLIKLIKLLDLILPKEKSRGHSVLLVAPKLVGSGGRSFPLVHSTWQGEREREGWREREGACAMHACLHMVHVHACYGFLDDKTCTCTHENMHTMCLCMKYYA